MINSAGGFNESLCYWMDFDLFCRLLEIVPSERVRSTRKIYGAFREYAQSKTGQRNYMSVFEGLSISSRYVNSIYLTDVGAIEREMRVARAFALMRQAENVLGNGRASTALSCLQEAFRLNPRLLGTKWGIGLMYKVIAYTTVGWR